jgi:AAHS family 4-hydroxybenzoate transporter-like MFS transporter
MKTVDLQAFLDRQPFSRGHLKVAVLAVLAMFIDGFDIFMLGKIAPAIAQGFGVTPAAMTLVFMMQQAGLAVGSFVVSPLSDLFGRKRLLVISFVIFGVLTIAAAYSRTILQLAILRGISGLFLAGVLPAALALVSEITPKRYRSTVTGLAMAGYSAGNAGGASVAFLVPVYGWEAAFWVGGLLPLALVPILAIFMYESIAYRVARNPKDPAIAATLARIDPTLALRGDEVFVLSQARETGKASVFDVFRQGRARATVAIWLCCTLSMGNIALLAAWLPTFFQEMAGVPIQRFAVAIMVALIGGLAGMSSVGFLMDRIQPVRLVSAYYVGNAVALVTLSQVPFEHPLFIVVLAIFAFCQSGGQGGLNILMTQIYPPAMRSTGIGWAGGAGRIGGVFAPAFGGYALAASFSLQLTLGFIALAPICVALLLILMLRPAHNALQRQGATAATG